MPRITFVQHDGAENVVEADVGKSLMDTAMRFEVPGIDADCGGSCSCATCHVYVEGDWANQVPPRGDMEGMMLEFAENVEPSSRLSCQIPVTESLDGLVVRIPASQR
jgi:2Fe-2S ferredoxin